jgi:hypothetical protein
MAAAPATAAPVPSSAAGPVATARSAADDEIGTDGTPVDVTLTAGQESRMTFAATAGQWARVWCEHVDVEEPFVDYRLLDPAGKTIADASYCWGDDSLFGTVALKVTGTYTLAVDPGPTNHGRVRIAVTVAQATAVVGTDGTPVSVTRTMPEQDATVTFAGTAGQRVIVQCDHGVEDHNFAEYTLLDPDLAEVVPGRVCYADDFTLFDTVTLTSTGTYTIRIEPHDVWVGTSRVAVHSAVDDLVTEMATDGSEVTFTTSPGQNARVSFSAVAGQRVRVSCDQEASLGLFVDLVLLDPAGRQLEAKEYCSIVGPLFDTTVTQTGTYTIGVDPEGVKTGATTLSVAAAQEVPVSGAARQSAM